MGKRFSTAQKKLTIMKALMKYPGRPGPGPSRS